MKKQAADREAEMQGRKDGGSKAPTQQVISSNPQRFINKEWA